MNQLKAGFFKKYSGVSALKGGVFESADEKAFISVKKQIPGLSEPYK
jgi:hypothetical protein